MNFCSNLGSVLLNPAGDIQFEAIVVLASFGVLRSTEIVAELMIQQVTSALRWWGQMPLLVLLDCFKIGKSAYEALQSTS